MDVRVDVKVCMELTFHLAPHQIMELIISQANVLLMRKHTADILHGTNPFPNMDYSPSIFHVRYSQCPSHLKCRYGINFLPCVKLDLGLHTMVYSTLKVSKARHAFLQGVVCYCMQLFL